LEFPLLSRFLQALPCRNHYLEGVYHDARKRGTSWAGREESRHCFLFKLPRLFLVARTLFCFSHELHVRLGAFRVSDAHIGLVEHRAGGRCIRYFLEGRSERVRQFRLEVCR